MKKHAGSFVVNGLLATLVLYWAIALSSSGHGRTFIDYAVIGVAASAVAWNMVRLGFRLHRIGGGRAVWQLQRTMLFAVIGLLNTVNKGPEQVDAWRNWLGWAMLVLAAIDVVSVYRMEQRGGGGGDGDKPDARSDKGDPADEQMPTLPRR